MYIEVETKYTVKPKSLYPIHRKHVGYYCTKCEENKLLSVMRLCRCLELEENPKRVKIHIDTFWAPLYADMQLHPPR